MAPILGFETPIGPGLAALSIAYVLGEGIGRLACINFGCCYGKPVDQVRGWVRRFSHRHHFVFTGHTKKIVFASGLEGEPVVPVQATTATLFALLSLGATRLFLDGLYKRAIPVSLSLSQIWRVYSETFRADYRGSTKVTASRLMAGTVGLGRTMAPLVLPECPGLRPNLS